MKSVKASKARKGVTKKQVVGKKGASVGSKIAIVASGAMLAAARAVATRSASRGKQTVGKSQSAPHPQNKAKSKNKKLVMPTSTKENSKEILPGGGIVLPATRTAPAMRLRADDAEILATAKERYGRKDLELFRKLIVDQQQEAREEFDILSQNILDTSGEFEADNQNYSLHTAEQGSDAIEREKTFLHAQRTSDYIKKLEEALERITRGTYGICVICGGLIEKERLQAVPITQKHVDCKNKTQPRKVGIGGGFHDVEEQPVNLD
ncbi:MAG TPA: TraR/DksA C4-type zinc finger protein [Candidatus Kapabacteria bacterium]|nr:TraR/DksA C4-type zinc finger protein [Candidatus Kapabacteria bacterium]